MSLKARIRTDASGNITVHMEGGLDYDNSTPLREELHRLTVENPTSTITIDMDALDFVGSSGIGSFVETLRVFNRNNKKVKISNVKNEFLRVFKLYNFEELESIIEDFDNDEFDEITPELAAKRKIFSN